MSNHLPLHKKVQILQMLCEGMSMRSISRTVDCSINTVNKLLVTVGAKCEYYQYMHNRNLNLKRVQLDEIWAFCYAKQKNLKRLKSKPERAGDIWTWTAVCPDTKLVICWHTGARTIDSASRIVRDLHTRLNNRVQITSDGFVSYQQAVEAAFGGSVDYAMLVKNYDGENLDIVKMPLIGNPDPAKISTSMVERQNLSMRMGMRRFTRKTNAHSKKIANHQYAIALYFFYFNYVRIHSSIRVTPAMEAGLQDHAWDWEEVLRM